MASTYENDLRLEEMATGENSGSWGTKTNTNLELVADAFSYGTETIADADTAITIADGAADAARSLALKINSSEDLTTTRVVTLGPNTTSKVWIIENNTSGGQTLTISAGSGSNVTLPNGVTKIIATDGIGAAANVTELYTNLHNITIDGILSLADGTNSAPSLTNTGDTNTGLYFPAADEVGLTVGGTQRLNINSTGSTLTGIAISNGLTLNTLALPSAGTATLFNRNTDNSLYIQTSSGNTVYLLDGSQNTMYAAAPTSHSFAISNVGVNTITATESVFNETGLDRDFRVESDGNDHMLFVDAQNDHVNIGTATDLGGVLNVDGNLSLSGNGTGNRYLALLAETDTYAGSLTIQAGGGSAGYGGSIKMYGHSHASKAGDVVLGISSGSGGQFRVHSGGTDTGTDRLTIGENGDFVTFPQANNAAVFNQAGVDSDFRVESDSNANMLFVDAGNNTVSLGTSSNPTTGAFAAPNLYIKGKATGTFSFIQLEPSSDQSVLGIGYDGTNNEFIVNSSYRATGGFRDLVFQYQASTNDIFRIPIGAGTEMVFNDSSQDLDFRVESDGDTHMLFVDAGNNSVGIGTSAPSQALDQAKQLVVGPKSGDNGITINSGTSGVGRLIFSDGTSGTALYSGYILYDHNANSFNIGTSGSERMKITNSEVILNEQSQDLDFRVESNSKTHMLFVDAGADTVHIGASTGSSVLNVDGTGRGGSVIALNVTNTDSGNDVNTLLNLTNNSDQDFQVKVSEVGATTRSTYMGPSTSTQLNITGSQVGNLNRDLYLDGSSLVVNQDSRDYDFRVESDSNANMLLVDAGLNTVQVGTTLTFGGFLNVSSGGVGVGESGTAGYYRRMYWNEANNEMRFWNGTNEARISSGGAFVDASDESLKKDIADIDYGIETVKSLQPRKYKMKDTGAEQVGFIAQEMETQVPEVVSTGITPDGDEQKGISYGQLTAVLTKAMQEQQTIIETLEARITALENA